MRNGAADAASGIGDCPRRWRGTWHLSATSITTPTRSRVRARPVLHARWPTNAVDDGWLQAIDRLEHAGWQYPPHVASRARNIGSRSRAVARSAQVNGGGCRDRPLCFSRYWCPLRPGSCRAPQQRRRPQPVPTDARRRQVTTGAELHPCRNGERQAAPGALWRRTPWLTGGSAAGTRHRTSNCAPSRRTSQAAAQSMKACTRAARLRLVGVIRCRGSDGPCLCGSARTRAPRLT